MRTTSEKLTSSQPMFAAQTLVVAGIAWAVLALLFFLLFSVPESPGLGRPLWYSIGTLIFELAAFLGAAILCFRNWRSPQIVSGRNVWLAIGIGMLCYFLGGVLFGLWELYWNLAPDVSLGDFFYAITYIALTIGMVMAVSGRKLNLEVWQWAVLGAIALAGIALAYWLAVAEPIEVPEAASPQAIEQVASPATGSGTSAPAPAPASSTPQTAPDFILAIDQALTPVAVYVNLFYVIMDVLLLILATALLLAFWGGRFSQSWRMIAAATFSLYIADMWFKYADVRVANYESGSLLEVFWIFSAVLFGIGAVLEYDISTRSRSRGRRRGGSSD
ncbi:hypothetical protein [Laspinema olomoucense]|uniref:hypothetical protein n=1 Tax=Laspinema olomoucense TaxID=3231600 RepID=UPI0021BB30B8|nr:MULTISPECIES: hypothetical protein [unclassified Laspinema]MCT7970685.1 hypothetical protein [Laspinema sp. D3d]MCT7987742.1 hypothetical protein [Laspinema sp. D3a]MCT7996499.1 hypothetical protein [Laspinema sp. D3c]